MQRGSPGDGSMVMESTRYMATALGDGFEDRNNVSNITLGDTSDVLFSVTKPI